MNMKKKKKKKKKNANNETIKITCGFGIYNFFYYLVIENDKVLKFHGNNSS